MRDRFTVEKNYSERDSEWVYDVVDHHPLRERRVVGWYSAEPSWEGDLNCGYRAAKVYADHLNAKYGYDSGRLAKSPFNKRFEDLVSPSGVGVG